MKIFRLKIGDLFCVNLNDINKGYFQFIGNDLTQLNSNVIKVFKHQFPNDANPRDEILAREPVLFYAHTLIRAGIKLGFWERVGNATIFGACDVLFRSSSDVGNKDVKISHNWWVWKMNDKQQRVGSLENSGLVTEVGRVVAPHNIVFRMKNGEYNFVYPRFQ